MFKLYEENLTLFTCDINTNIWIRVINYAMFTMKNICHVTSFSMCFVRSESELPWLSYNVLSYVDLGNCLSTTLQIPVLLSIYTSYLDWLLSNTLSPPSHQYARWVLHCSRPLKSLSAPYLKRKRNCMATDNSSLHFHLSALKRKICCQCGLWLPKVL